MITSESESKLDRVDVWKATVEFCKDTTMFVPARKSVKLNHIDMNCSQLYPQTTVHVVNTDTINATITLYNKGYRPLLLNMSDDKVPGGCVASGSPAQEENLFRRSNYFMHLTDEFYPIEGCSVVYSPGVIVFKEDEASLYKVMSKPRRVDIIACPALRFPQIEKDFKTLSNKDEISLMLEKIRMIFKTAYIYGHDSLVLSAHGCEAWGDPPEHISKLYAQAIEEYKGCFKYIIFAVLREHNNKQL